MQYVGTDVMRCFERVCLVPFLFVCFCFARCYYCDTIVLYDTIYMMFMLYVRSLLYDY